jgi:hypothetical protein
MADKSRDNITFDRLLVFLRSIGFDQPAKVNNSLAFHHRESGTIIMLSIPPDGRSVRSADLLSVMMRLESDGLVDDSVLKQFKSGNLQIAS